MIDKVVDLMLLETDSKKREILVRESGLGVGFIEALKAEVDRLKDTDSAKALLAGERALEASEFIDDPRAKPLGLWANALGLTVQGSFAESIPFYEAARSGFREIGQLEDAERTSIREIQALAMLGDMNAALTLAEEARENFIGMDLIYEAAMTSQNLALIHLTMGRLKDSEAVLKYALRQFISLKNPLEVAKVHNNLGNLYQEQDRFSDAIEHFQAAIPIFKELSNTYTFAGVCVNLAVNYRRVGRLSEALDLLSRSKTVFESLSDNPHATYAQLEEARVHLEMNMLSEAEKLAQGVVDFYGTESLHDEQGEALLTLGTVKARLGKFEEALTNLRGARQVWRSIDNLSRAAQADIVLSMLWLEIGRKGDPVAIEKAVLTATEAIEALKDAPSAKALALTVLAEGYIEMGNRQAARVKLRDAMFLSEELNLPELSIRIDRLLGQIAKAEGKLPTAEGHYKAAVDRFENVRASLTVDEFKSAYIGDKLAVYGDLVDLLVSLERGAEGFEYAERAKSRALLDLLSRTSKGAEVIHDPEVEKLTKELVEARAKLNQWFLELEASDGQAEFWEKVKNAEAEVTRMVRELERLHPEAILSQELPEITLQDIKNKLPNNATLVEYFVTGTELIAFVIDQNQTRVVRNLGPLDKVRHYLEQLDFYLQRVPQGGVYLELYGEAGLLRSANEQLSAIFELIFAPLELDYADKPLIIVPHGILHAIPFGALLDNGTYLLEKTEVSIAPSSAVFVMCRNRPNFPLGPLVAFGVPVEDIPQAIEEVKSLCEVAENSREFTGEDATILQFFNQAPLGQVLHIATHGAYRPDSPMFSGLRMADGWLAARDLYGLRLNANLVVLSACETGMAKQSGGDELLGLARGFLYAGTPSLVASLWAVKDDATATFMADFYRQLRDGNTVGASLRLAQLNLKKTHPNPYYWGAFSVTGDPERMVNLNSPKTTNK